MSDIEPQKPWYKHWWGIILVFLTWPISLLWLIWKITNWNIVAKIAATSCIIALVLLAYLQLELIQISYTISTKSHSAPISSSSNQITKSPGYVLAEYDLAHEPDTPTVAKYQAVLDGLQPFCTENEVKMASEIWASRNDLQKNGITYKTNLNLIEDTRNSFLSPTPRNCLGILSLNLLLLEPLIRH